jgi:hypothetical protein
MPKTDAHPDLHGDYANVVSLPPEARPVGFATRAALIATAERAIGFHEEVARYHQREAQNLKGQVAKLKEPR